MDGGDRSERLLGWLRLLVDAAAVTGDEAALAGRLAGLLEARHAVLRVGDSLVVGTPARDRPTVALVGHLDVVPPTPDDLPLRLVEGADGLVAHGRGTSDMHAGNAVALDLLEQHPPRAPVGVVLVLYAREEGPDEENELTDVLATVDWLAGVDLAVVLEPTDGEVHLGCLGGLHARITFVGRQAHSARPWHGRNALTAAGGFLAAMDRLAPTVVEVDGVPFRDVWSVTQAATENARNVVPGRFTLNLNFRFSPSRTAAEAEVELRDRVAALTASVPEVEVEVAVVDVAHPAPPRRGDPLVDRLLRTVGGPVQGKQAWTDVARLAALGVPAVNFGPGATAQAHQRGEHVEVATMLDVHARLARFLRDAPG